VHNDDTIAHIYSLSVTAVKDNATIDSYGIDVDSLPTFSVDAGDTLNFVGMLHASQDTCVLTLELLNNDSTTPTAIDSVQTNLAALEGGSSDLTLIGGGVSSNMLSTIIEVMLVMMIMKMMMGAVSPQNAKEPVYPKVASGG
jgi:hypothetical protein